jgi:putative addiction module CopG family antidote
MVPYPPEIEEYVQQKVLSGRFRSREELAVEAMRVYRELEMKHAQLKADVRAGIDESDRGLSAPLDIEAIKAELIAELGPNRDSS